MIRPSMLNRAELCGLAPVLAEKYPETGDAAVRGTAIHWEIAAILKGNPLTKEPTPEALAAASWVNENAVGMTRVEEKLSLIDTDTMEVITEGTPDLVAGPDTTGVMLIVDFKTGNPENVEDVDSNLQLIAYGLAAAGDAYAFRCVLLFLDGDKVFPQWSRIFEATDHQSLLDRVKAAASAEASARPGDHCGSCWQRRYCHAWHAREMQALSLIEGDSSMTVTNDNAGKIMARVKAVKDAADAAEAIVKAHVRNGGACIVDGKQLVFSTCKGRESADVKALKADGLDKYIKQGEAYERAAWKKVSKEAQL